ncbi:hypothetical protein FE243_00165 [Aliarcobacter thereius]|uniref:EI24 domain-containing protein n=1 Tax=Aliarcobacter thereius TaxID=544718 RepID=UPI0010FE8978|nr:EI24 domain-containing protein [Aliarcobacter thereius]TLT08344.1 hypothetical protein FE243_00165 [Aliarcobacter thereius]
MNEIELISKSIKDFFSSSMLKIALVPLILTMVLLYIMFFTFAGFGIEGLKLIAENAQSNGEIIIDENLPFYTIGTIFVFHISIIFTLLIIGFLTPLIVGNLHKKYYSHLELKAFGNIFNATTTTLKAIFVMLFLYILFIPIYFIPIINLLAFYLPLYYFFHKLLNFDVASTILSKDEYEKIYTKNSSYFRLRTLGLYFISTIPFITLFVAVFYVIYLSHLYFIKLEELRK